MHDVGFGIEAIGCLLKHISKIVHCDVNINAAARSYWYTPGDFSPAPSLPPLRTEVKKSYPRTY